ncbi:putative protein kinase [Zostera marina]|uniref:Protein kinase domain-containing protein n=1 Tax=Zostera marina TaxID=29655 RepID=A0A0K9NNG5_ZOSMR|nr:putative protein kinase [Zostera marina]
MKGYHRSNKNYSGDVSLFSLRKSSKKKTIKIGPRKYCIQGCAGQGGFALVFKAIIENNPEDFVALKIQCPPFPWEFYMYRQLDQRISGLERSCFGYAHRVHIYSDRSILVTDYYSHGTLQDIINSYVVIGGSMDEILCIYYTIEMLQMLENLHAVSLIHGDFKPDNLLIRYASTCLTEDSFSTRTGPWSEKGLCLVDWGRGIDLSLFSAGTEFEGDCRTSGFRCVQMQEKQPWTYQVDTYGLCVCVHMLLHGDYMIIEKKHASDGLSYYYPKSPLKRYWNKDLWSNFFSTLLNTRSNDNDVQVLQHLRISFEDFLCKNPKLIYKLKDLLTKQKASLCK